MFIISIETFEWASIRRLKRIKRADAVILVSVTIVTIFANLAFAVISGVIISAFVFAWEHAKIFVSTRIKRGWYKGA